MLNYLSGMHSIESGFIILPLIFTAIFILMFTVAPRMGKAIPLFFILIILFYVNFYYYSKNTYNLDQDLNDLDNITLILNDKPYGKIEILPNYEGNIIMQYFDKDTKTKYKLKLKEIAKDEKIHVFERIIFITQLRHEAREIIETIKVDASKNKKSMKEANIQERLNRIKSQN